MPFFVYIAECSDKSYYCGYTVDLDARVKQHNSPDSKTKYTRTRQPVKLVYTEEFATKSGAMKKEASIKRLSRTQKEKLITSYIID